MNVSYIANNPAELFDQAPPVVKEVLQSGAVDKTVREIAEKNKLSVGTFIPLGNIITFVLINALQPENVVQALVEILKVEKGEAQNIANDLEKGLFQEVRNKVIGKNDPVVKLSFKPEGNNDEALRKKLLDTTKRESGLVKEQSSNVPAQKQSVITPGSRNQLLEQLQVLGTIPNDEEVEARLKHIQEQLASIQQKEEEAEPDVKKVPVAVYNFGKDGDRAIEAIEQPASYSVAPTKYNVDPYRELAEN